MSALDFRLHMQTSVGVTLYYDTELTDIVGCGDLVSFNDGVNGVLRQDVDTDGLPIAVEIGNLIYKTTIEFVRFDKCDLM